MNVTNLDLNLLVVLDALLQTRSVGAAAEKLCVTQPAVSNALRRLQESLGHPLFIREGRRLVPTTETLAQGRVIRKALVDVEQALFKPAAFDPKHAEGRVTLAMSDYWHAQLLPALVSRLEAQAPGVELYATNTGEDIVAKAVPAGEVDAAIYLYPRAIPKVRAELLVSDNYVAAIREGHPLSKRRLSLQDFAALRQVIVSPEGPWHNQVGDAMHREGLSADVALRTPHMAAAIDIVARTNYITILARRPAQQLAVGRKVRLLPLPVRTDDFSLGLYWPERLDKDDLHRWFRTLCKRLAKEAYLRR